MQTVATASLSPKFKALVRTDTAVRRTRLLERVTHGVPTQAKACAVVAPAGFGKTTLLAQLGEHLASTGEIVVWFNCDEQDRSANAFMNSLTQACRVWQVPGSATSGGMVLTAIGADDAERSPVSVIIDEFERAVSPETCALLEQIIVSLAPHVSVFVGCRETGTLDIMRLALQGTVRLVDARELKFNHDETRSLFGDELNPTLCRQVVETCDGWAVMLQLVRLSLPHVDTTHWLNDASRLVPARQAFDYMANEVWRLVPARLRDFLEATIVLSDIDPSSADALVGRNDSAGTIACLRDLHPLVNVDEYALQARVHPQLRDFIRHTIQCRDATAVSRMHIRASAYFESKGLLFDAIAHALRADRPSLACRIVDRAGGFRVGVSHGMWFVASLLEIFPAQVIDANVRLRLMAICLDVVENNGLENAALLDGIEADLREQGLADDTHPAWIDLRYARAVLALGLGERSLVFSPWEMLDTLKDEAQRRVHMDPRLLGIVQIVALLHVQRCLSVDVSRARTAALAKLNARFRFEANTVWQPLYEAQNAFHGGQFAIAELHLADMLRKEFEVLRSKQSAFGQMAYALLGRLHYVRGNVEEALACFGQMPTTGQSPFLEVAEGGVICRAFCEMASGNPDGALHVLDSARVEAAEQGRETCLLLIDATRVEIYSRLGDMASAQALFDRMTIMLCSLSAKVEYSPDRLWLSPDVPWCITFSLARARCYLHMASGDYETASAMARALAQAATAEQRVVAQVTGEAMQAQALYCLGRHAQASALLCDALDRCDPMPPAQVFLEHAPALIGELWALRSAGQAKASAAETVLRVWERELGHHMASLGVLSRRECDVLLHLAGDRATKQIARDLSLSPETVKFHLKAIYGKLQVGSREDAVSEIWRRVQQRQCCGVSRGIDGGQDSVVDARRR
ncbi:MULTISPECIES: LuxR C-terminal-related transcriptional regulator [Pandoraea]|uniref:LuxR C-terminal-related transcriptional regulator n=1 Tax=Pandoraea TaxID=93217 RepID=UPI001F5D8FD6|nr:MULTISPECIES: LuxR C-terminal-related transcriptional regulator [Pandoraea]